MFSLFFSLFFFALKTQASRASTAKELLRHFRESLFDKRSVHLVTVEVFHVSGKGAQLLKRSDLSILGSIHGCLALSSSSSACVLLIAATG